MPRRNRPPNINTGFRQDRFLMHLFPHKDLSTESLQFRASPTPSSSHPGLILSLDTPYHLSSIDPLRVSSAPVKKNRTPSHSSKGRFALMCSGLLLDHQSGHLCSLYPSDQTLTQSCLDFAGLESKSLLWWLCIPLRLIIKWYPCIDMWGIWIFFSHFPRIF